jgi:putative spermidine/putrescine transport system permease protein
MGMHSADGSRPWTFYVFAAFFGLFVAFLYGPMTVIYILSFQGPQGGMTFPMNGFSLEWFQSLFAQKRVGDIAGAFVRSIELALVVAVITVVLSVVAGLAFRRRFRGSAFVFYLAIASLIMPGLFVGLGIALTFRLLGLPTEWYTTGIGAQLTWTLPFGLLIMFAVFNRFDGRFEEAARDLGATPWQTVRHVVLPIIAPSLVGIGLFGFTLSWDEVARSSQAFGSDQNTLPLELTGLTTTITNPEIYALGTVTTGVSLLMIGVSLLLIQALRRSRARRVPARVE